MEGSGYGPQNEGAPLMSAGWMGAGTGGGDGVSGEMGADREERLYLCLEFGLLRVLQSAPPRLGCVSLMAACLCTCVYTSKIEAESRLCMNQD